MAESGPSHDSGSWALAIRTVVVVAEPGRGVRRVRAARRAGTSPLL